MLDFVIATHNKNKVEEIENILKRIFEGFEKDNGGFSVITAGQLGIGEIEENGNTFEENARIKASALTGKGYIAIADDSGLEVDALGGAPGVFSARYSGGDSSENNRKLLKELDGVPVMNGRQIRFRYLLYFAGWKRNYVQGRMRRNNSQGSGRRRRIWL